MSLKFPLFIIPKTKAALSITGFISLFSTVTYYGVVKPFKDNKSARILEGSDPLLEARKEDEVLIERGNRKNIPSVWPALTINHLHPKSKNAYRSSFSGEVAKALEPNASEITSGGGQLWGKRYNAKTTFSATRLRDIDKDIAILSDIEIPFKAYTYIKRINDYTKEKIIQDLLWSLAEESKINKTSIRPQSIKIDFEIEQASKDYLEKIEKNKVQERVKNYFPVPANKIRNFQIKFLIFNPNKRKTTVFRNITINPQKEVEVTVKMPLSEIRPLSIPLKGKPFKGISWGLFPLNNHEFEIAVREVFPQRETTTYQQKKLNLMNGRTKFIDEALSMLVANMGTYGIGSINTPTFKDFRAIAEPRLVGITKEQIKQDIENWYGSYGVYTLRLMINDLKKLMNILNMRIFNDSNGRKSSISEIIVNEPQWRTGFYNHVLLQEEMRKILDNWFAESGKEAEGYQLQAKEFMAFVSTIAYTLEQMVENMEVTTTWVEEPTLGISEDEVSNYPTVSFKFKHKYSWKKKITIPFKGCWNKKDKSFSEDTNSCSGDGKEKFDFTSKIKQVDKIFNPVKELMSSEMAGVKIFEALMPDSSQFMWEKLEIEKDESIESTYTAIKSPIKPAISANYDSRSEFPVIGGWKALDVSWDLDLSNFNKFFYKIYEGLDTFEDKDGIKLDATVDTIKKLINIKDTLKAKPVSTIVHLLNLIFDKNYLKKENTPEDKRPIPAFFKSLLSKAININSTQMFVGYSSTLFDTEEWVKDNSKTSETTNSRTYKTNKNWPNKDEHKNQDEVIYPSTPKTEELKNIFANMQINFSTNFPKEPVIFKFDKTDKWNKFLEQEGSSNAGFIKHLDQMKEIFIDNYHNQTICFNHGKVCEPSQKVPVNYFPDKQFVNWEKVKISATPIEMSKALKTVLNLENSVSALLSHVDNLTSVGATLGATKNIKIVLSNILGEAIQRDMMLLTVNMMLEDGSMIIKSDPFIFTQKNTGSTSFLEVMPKIDIDKLGIDIKSLGA